MAPMEENLFAEFTPVDRDKWLTKIETDLKGKALEALDWEAAGLSGGPIYTQEDLPDPLPAVANTNAKPELFGARYWVNYQPIAVADAKAANQKALHALNNGADGLLFVIHELPDFAVLLKDIKLAYCHVSFDNHTGKDLHQAYVSYLRQSGVDLDAVHGFIRSNGTQTAVDQGPFGLKSLNISNDPRLAGKPVMELAGLLAKTAQQYDELTEEGSSARPLFDTTQFELATGSSYFAEIAKFRALRALVIRFASAYEVTLAASEVNILAQTSDWTTALDDPHSHLLSATTQAMAAIIGGADALCVQSFSSVFPDAPDLAARAARNISSILKDESYLGQVVDPSAGTYYIESLTAQITEQAWALFLAIEAAGGYQAQTPEQIESLYEKTSR